MRVMPSVTDTIEPTLRASVTALKFSIRCFMRSLISVALIAMSLVLYESLASGRQLVGDALEPRAQRPVDHEVPRAQHRPADQPLIDLAVQAHRALQSLLERGGELLFLGRVERCRGGDRDVGDALRGVLELIEQRADLRQVSEAPVDGEHAHEVRALTPKLRPRDAAHQLRELPGRHAR